MATNSRTPIAYLVSTSASYSCLILFKFGRYMQEPKATAFFKYRNCGHDDCFHGNNFIVELPKRNVMSNSFNNCDCGDHTVKTMMIKLAQVFMLLSASVSVLVNVIYKLFMSDFVQIWQVYVGAQRSQGQLYLSNIETVDMMTVSMATISQWNYHKRNLMSNSFNNCDCGDHTVKTMMIKLAQVFMLLPASVSVLVNVSVYVHNHLVSRQLSDSL